MRTFIAVEIPAEIKKKIVEIQEKLKGSQALVRWVEEDKLHFTLKFLGEVAENKIAEFCKKLNDKVLNFGDFRIEVAGLGVFPTLTRPRIFWVGGGGGEKLVNLAEIVENVAVGSKIAQKENRKFSAHVTVGRIKGKRNIDKLTPEVKKLEDCYFGSFEVSSIVVMKSSLKAGSVYEVLKRIEI